MFSLATIAIAIISGLGLVTGALLVFQHVEFRRFVRSRLRESEHMPQRAERVALIVPIKGLDVGIEENLAALFWQDYENYEIVFVVESRGDLAVPAIRAVIGRHPRMRSRLVIAGLANDSGQKVHNLSQAVRALDGDARILAFVDADTRPPRRWLRTLVCRLDEGNNGAASAYPWYVPERATLPNLMLCSIVSSIVALCGRHHYNLITGPSWAIRREAFDSAGILAAWQGTLSDDLVATQAIWRAGLRVEFEPACMGTSHVDVSWSRMFEFLRRQTIIVRSYSLRHWLIGVFGSTVTQLALWGNLLAAAVLLERGEAACIVPALVVAALSAMSFARAWLRQNAISACLPQHATSLATARWFDLLANPLSGLIFCGIILGSAVGDCITWRSNRYRILRGGKIKFLGTGAARPIMPAPRAPVLTLDPAPAEKSPRRMAA
jgi:cellulose synthase/poly-beta-1,6-N-acetylglucosamine synthase-like glycosyltransferase